LLRRWCWRGFNRFFRVAPAFQPVQFQFELGQPAGKFPDPPSGAHGVGNQPNGQGEGNPEYHQDGKSNYRFHKIDVSTGGTTW
jgi:hypothetical protein